MDELNEFIATATKEELGELYRYIKAYKANPGLTVSEYIKQTKAVDDLWKMTAQQPCISVVDMISPLYDKARREGVNGIFLAVLGYNYGYIEGKRAERQRRAMTR